LAALPFCRLTGRTEKAAHESAGSGGLWQSYDRSDAPGCREVVIHDQTAILVPIEKSVGTGCGDLDLANSVQLRDRYGQAARKLVVEKLSARIIGNSVVGLYDELTRNRHHRFTGARRSIQRTTIAEHWEILLVTQHYAPFPSTTSGYMTEIAEELAQDCDVTVLSGTPDSNSKALPKPLFPAIMR